MRVNTGAGVLRQKSVAEQPMLRFWSEFFSTLGQWSCSQSPYPNKIELGPRSLPAFRFFVVPQYPGLHPLIVKRKIRVAMVA